MTAARLERIEPDPWLARAFLERARELLRDGASTAVSPAGRQMTLHGATVAACDAVLAIEGLEVVAADGGHVLRLRETEPLLAGDAAALFERLDDARMTRHEASYRAGFVPMPDLADALEAVSELLRLVEQHVEPQLPPYG